MGQSDCVKCMSRIPYATLIATIMCCAGVGVFCGTMHRGVTLTLHMMNDVFHFEVFWLDIVQMIFVVVGVIMGGLGLLLLLVGFLTTGSTREKVYKRWKARLGGLISCAILMVITYILNFIWMVIFVCLIVVTTGFTLAWNLCNTRDPNKKPKDCIDFNQFDFLFPNNTKSDVMSVCGPVRLNDFCKKYVEQAEVMFVLASISCLLVILSLVHYLACLSANYAHIKDHEKFEELQELQYLADNEMGTLPKDRF